MSPQDVIEHFGTLSNAARALEVQPSSVHEWKTKGEIEITRQALIEIVTRGRLRADRRKLRALDITQQALIEVVTDGRFKADRTKLPRCDRGTQ
jgi:hypothetical protein